MYCTHVVSTCVVLNAVHILVVKRLHVNFLHKAYFVFLPLSLSLLSLSPSLCFLSFPLPLSPSQRRIEQLESITNSTPAAPPPHTDINSHNLGGRTLSRGSLDGSTGNLFISTHPSSNHRMSSPDEVSNVLSLPPLSLSSFFLPPLFLSLLYMYVLF